MSSLLIRPVALPLAAAVLWGSWNALCAQRLKLLAAYSTVAQLGYLFLFFPLLASLLAGPARDAAFGALLLLALTHGFAKSALFLAAGVIQQHAGHDRIRDLGGTARTLPVTTFTLALAGVALIGLPPSGTFCQPPSPPVNGSRCQWSPWARCWARPAHSGCSVAPLDRVREPVPF